MSRENVEIVRGWFARLSAGDPAPDLCDPAIEIRNWAESPVPGPYHGHEGVRKWFRGVNDPDIGLEMQFFELVEVVEVDEERVVTIQRATGRGRRAASSSTSDGDRSSACGMARSASLSAIRLPSLPSKPPGCRSSALDEEHLSASHGKRITPI